MRGPRRSSRSHIVFPAALAVIACSLSGCGEVSILRPEGPIAAGNRTIMLNSLVIMLAIIVPTIVAGLIFAWWFRASNPRAQYRPDFTYSGRIELIVWSIPTLTIIFLGGLIWIGSHELDPWHPIASKEKPLEVQVVSLDWKWLFIYPEEGIASVNQLEVPAGRPVHFSLTSASVMNAFFVPRLGSMVAVMYGMETQLNLQADRAGTYYGESTQFSGDGFSGMNFQLRAVAPGAFDAWIAAARGSGPSLDAAGYARLSQQSLDVKPFTYGSVARGLFDDIVAQKLPAGPGPEVGRGGPKVIPRGNDVNPQGSS